MHTIQSAGKFVDTCVIGLGVSSLPLVRLLDRSEHSYAVISAVDFGVWSVLSEEGNDNFDLLSSDLASSYSWWSPLDEGVPFFSAREYYTKLIAERTPSIERHILREKAQTYIQRPDGTYEVRNALGETIVRCQNLVITTGQSVDGRKICEMLQQCWTVRNETVLIDGYGDSVNMMISRLMVGQNKVFVSTEHFTNLDKVIEAKGHPGEFVGLDTLEEYQHFVHNNHERARNTLYHTNVSPYCPGVLPTLFRKRSNLEQYIQAEDFCYDNSNSSYLSSALQYASSEGVSNGFGYPVKYWPAYAYFSYFDNPETREQLLQNRFLLNDPYLFMASGQLEVFHRKRVQESDVPAGDGRRQFIIDGRVVAVDRVFGSKASFPKPIRVAGVEDDYEYRYRENLHGIWSKHRPNLFFIGGERPSTGGFAATGEIQSRFVYKLVSDAWFKDRMVSDYDANFAYWQRNALDTGAALPKIEHTQFTGMTTLALTSLMGEERTMWDSLRSGTFFTYLGGPQIAARTSPDPKSQTWYRRWCRRYSDGYGLSILQRASYVRITALNLMVFFLAEQRYLLAALSALLLLPRLDKLVKALTFPIMSFGVSPSSFRGLHNNGFAHVCGIGLVSLFLNLAIWSLGVDVFEMATWAKFLLLGAIPLSGIAVVLNIGWSYWWGTLLFNDVRRSEAYLSRIEGYMDTVRSTTWYQDLTTPSERRYMARG